MVDGPILQQAISFTLIILVFENNTCILTQVQSRFWFMNSKKVGNRFKQKLSQVRFKSSPKLRVDRVEIFGHDSNLYYTCMNHNLWFSNFIKSPCIDSFTKGCISFLGWFTAELKKMKGEFRAKTWHLVLTGEQLRVNLKPTVENGSLAFIKLILILIR